MKKTVTLFFLSVIFFRFSFAQQCFTYSCQGQPIGLLDVIKSSDGGLIYSSTYMGYGAVLKTGTAGNVEWFNYLPLPRYNNFGLIETADKQIVALLKDTTQQIVVFRMDAAGNLLWTKRFAYSLYNSLSRLVATSDSGCIGIASGCVGSNVALKLDKNGNTVWQNNYSSAGSSSGWDIVGVDNTTVAIEGISYDTTGAGNVNVSLFKILQSDGSLLWYKSYDVGTNDGAARMLKTSDGGFTLSGGTGLLNSTYPDMFLLHTDASGNVLWTKHYHSDGDLIGVADVTELDNGDYGMAGYVADTSFQDSRALVIRTDASGNILWQKSTDNSNQTGGRYSNGIENMGGGRFIVLGDEGMRPVIWDMLGADGFCAEIQENVAATAVNPAQTNVQATVTPVAFYIQDLHVTDVKQAAVKSNICQLATGMSDHSSQTPGLQISPNPFTSEFVLKTDEVLQNAQLKIFDITGKLLYEKELTGNNFTIQIALQPAMYTAEIKNGKGSTIIQKIIKTN